MRLSSKLAAQIELRLIYSFPLIVMRLRLDHKRRSQKRKKIDTFSSYYDSGYYSYFPFSLDRKRSYKSDSDSIVSENHCVIRIQRFIDILLVQHSINSQCKSPGITTSISHFFTCNTFLQEALKKDLGLCFVFMI